MQYYYEDATGSRKKVDELVYLLSNTLYELLYVIREAGLIIFKIVRRKRTKR